MMKVESRRDQTKNKRYEHTANGSPKVDKELFEVQVQNY